MLEACGEFGQAGALLLADELHFHAVGNQAGFETHVEQFLRGLRNDFAAVHCEVVDVHADKLLRQPCFQVAGELHGIFEGFVVVVERILNALTHQAAAFTFDLRIEGTKEHIRAQRQRETVSGFKPAPQVDNAAPAVDLTT